MKIDNLNNEKKEKKNQSYPVSPVFVIVVEKLGKWMNFEFGKKMNVKREKKNQM